VKAIEIKDANTLAERIKIRVRFSEVDSLKMVWHGSYVKYLEDGREAFGRKYGLEYLYVYREGYIIPVVDMHIQYKFPATVDDVLTVETIYVPNKGAKLVFEYKIYRENGETLILSATTIQLFQTADGLLEVSKPDFFREWEKQNNII